MTALERAASVAHDALAAARSGAASQPPRSAAISAGAVREHQQQWAAGQGGPMDGDADEQDGQGGEDGLAAGERRRGFVGEVPLFICIGIILAIAHASAHQDVMWVEISDSKRPLPSGIVGLARGMRFGISSCLTATLPTPVRHVALASLPLPYIAVVHLSLSQCSVSPRSGLYS